MQAGSPGITNSLQQELHSPVWASKPSPHSGQRGGKAKSISGAMAAAIWGANAIRRCLTQPGLNVIPGLTRVRWRLGDGVPGGPRSRVKPGMTNHTMTSAAPPTIFDPARRIAARRRMLALQQHPDAPRYLIEDMIEDVAERLAFLRVSPARALVIGDWTGELTEALRAGGAEVIEAEPAAGFAEEQPFPFANFDFIASLGTLDTVNDLPGALIHLRSALATGGLMIASFPGAGSLPILRAAMLAADGERPAPRIHPLVDPRAGGQLLQRAGFADPVVDTRNLDVRFSALTALVTDARAQGLSNVLERRGPPLHKAALARARTAFGGPTVEQFEILTLSGWRK